MSSNAASGNCETKKALENRRLLQRILFDLVLIVVLIIPIIVCEFAVEPFRRGFFCDDETIRYPFQDNTISVTMLGLIVLLKPFVVLAIGEYASLYQRSQVATKRQVFGYNIAIWKLNFCKQFAYFVFGLLLTFNATELAKYTIGRLRPHFMAVCQPQLVDGTTCYDLVNKHRYVENYFCLGTGFTMQDVRQARLSFPSGHSSLAFYASVYISMYLQKCMRWRLSNLCRHFLQFAFIMLAWFIALSRIMDSWHHWSDVLAGCIIGVIGALINANVVSGLLKTSYLDFGSLSTSTAHQESGMKLREVIVATPPPYTLNQQPTVKSIASETFSTKV